MGYTGRKKFETGTETRYNAPTSAGPFIQEDTTMIRTSGIFLSLTLGLAICLCQAAVAAPQNAAKHKAASAHKMQWQGHIVRIAEDKSSMSIRGGRSPKDNFERTVMFDPSTQWTKGGKQADQAEFKEGSFVIVEGNVDKKGMLHADRVDLRLPR